MLGSLRPPQPPSTPMFAQIQQAAATSVAMFAGLLSADHLREHLSAVVDELMRNYDGAATAGWLAGRGVVPGEGGLLLQPAVPPGQPWVTDHAWPAATTVASSLTFLRPLACAPPHAPSQQTSRCRSAPWTC